VVAGVLVIIKVYSDCRFARSQLLTCRYSAVDDNARLVNATLG
jgi:hypothetical protein